MSTYVVGDVHGCSVTLQRLLDNIHYSDADTLWFVGDLVNRGPDSLGVLRLVKSLKRKVVTIGNHDLHLLAIRDGFDRFPRGTPLLSVLEAPDVDELCAWLRQLPFLHHDAALGYVMVHAGIWPHWDLEMAQALSKEAEAALAASDGHFWEAIYGDTPELWSDDLRGDDRLRFIINVFTRMRYVRVDGALAIPQTGPPGTQPEGLWPWYDAPNRMQWPVPVLFGHWSSMRGECDTPGIHALDGGCAWGEKLIAMRLEDHARFEMPCADGR